MATKVRFGGAWRELIGCRIFSAGAWREILAVRVYSGGSWRLVGNFTPSGSGGGGGSEPAPTTPGGGVVTVSISPAPLEALITSSASSTATPSGGLAPYTYLWSRTVTSGNGTVALTNSDRATVTAAGEFSISDGNSLGYAISVLVTDSLGTTATAETYGEFYRIS